MADATSRFKQVSAQRLPSQSSNTKSKNSALNASSTMVEDQYAGTDEYPTLNMNNTKDPHASGCVAQAGDISVQKGCNSKNIYDKEKKISPVEDKTISVTAQTPANKSFDSMKVQWNDSWIFEQERRGVFERKLQSNEAWWPAAMSVMREAEFQNSLLRSIIDQQINLECESANSLGDIAVAAAGIEPSDQKTSKDQKLSRIVAAVAATTSDLAPGRILSQLGTELGAEALRKLHTATQCRKLMIVERVDPMSSEFSEALAKEAAKGHCLLEVGRSIDSTVRQIFEDYDRAARHSQSVLSQSEDKENVVEIEQDIWLNNLRWRVACVWQGSLWKEITRRFRNLFEALHKLEHHRRVVWLNVFQVWKQTAARSFKDRTGVPPFSETLERSLMAASSSGSITHSEMMSAIKQRVPASLADAAPLESHEEESSHPHTALHYSPVVGNPLVVACELLEHRFTYGAGLITAWESVVALVSIHGNLLLFPVSKDNISRAAKRCSVRAHTTITHPPAHSLLAEWLASLDPINAALPAGHTKAAQVAANARAEAARTGPMPDMPPKLSPGVAVVLAKCTLGVMPLGENLLELTEQSEGSGLFGLFTASSSSVTAIRATDENTHNRVLQVLKKYTKQSQTK